MRYTFKIKWATLGGIVFLHLGALLALFTAKIAVAEGIKAADDLEMLKTLGVKYGQGFLLGRPG